MVRKSLKGVRSPVSYKKKERYCVNEMATPTRKSGKKLWVHGLFKVTQWGPNLLIMIVVSSQQYHCNMTEKTKKSHETVSSRALRGGHTTCNILGDQRTDTSRRKKGISVLINNPRCYNL